MKFINDFIGEVKKYLSGSITKYNLSIVSYNDNEAVLKNEHCTILLVNEADHVSLKFHSTESSEAEDIFSVRYFYEVVYGKNHGKKFNDSPNNLKIEESVRFYLQEINYALYNNFEKPFEGDFSWKYQYKIRESYLERLADIIFNEGGGEIMDKYFDWNPTWEEDALEFYKAKYKRDYPN